jgi:putative oxidoreductase
MTAITLDRTTSSPLSIGRRVFSAIVATDASTLAAALRIVLAVVFFPHGAQKLLGWFGGYGFTGTMGYFASLGIPALFGVLAIAAEAFGSVALFAGFGTRIAAIGVAANMTVAALMVHAKFGFFMNWFGNQKGEGIEYHILAIALAATVAVLGAGGASVDGLLSRKFSR